jgi:diguanylate cyclase (GGDEF)-like protein
MRGNDSRSLRARPWWLLVATVGLSVLANLGWAPARNPSGVPRFPSLGDLFYACSLVLLTASVYWWIRLGRYRGGLIDAAIALTGGGAVVWVTGVAPLLFGDRFSGLRLVSYLCYTGVDLVILAFTVRVAVVSRVRTVAYRLMVGAATVWVVTDTAYYAALFRGVVQPVRFAAVGWLAAYVLIGAAALHPSMARSTGSMPQNAVLLSRTRLAAYVVLTAVIAALGVVVAATAWPDHQAWRVIVLLCLGCTTSVLLIARLAQLGAALNRRAHVDPLTGLGNRVVLQSSLHRRAVHDRLLLVLDLDGFREINAAFGHPAGDAVLVESGHRLRATAPSDAVVVRLDGDAFAVLAAGGEAVLDSLAERLLAAVAEPHRVAGLTSRRVNVSAHQLRDPAFAERLLHRPRRWRRRGRPSGYGSSGATSPRAITSRDRRRSRRCTSCSPRSARPRPHDRNRGCVRRWRRRGGCAAWPAPG